MGLIVSDHFLLSDPSAEPGIGLMFSFSLAEIEAMLGPSRTPIGVLSGYCNGG